jgi:hypothetical protein
MSFVKQKSGSIVGSNVDWLGQHMFSNLGVWRQGNILVPGRKAAWLADPHNSATCTESESDWKKADSEIRDTCPIQGAVNWGLGCRVYNNCWRRAWQSSVWFKVFAFLGMKMQGRELLYKFPKASDEPASWLIFKAPYMTSHAKKLTITARFMKVNMTDWLTD